MLRTLSELAAEVGTTPPNLARIAAKYGIDLRERGGASHAASLRAPIGFPEPLATAALGQAGWTRVRRFQICAGSRSMNSAAKVIGCSAGVLSTQVARLDRACGGPLLVRTGRDQRPQQLTKLGRCLLAQADEHLGANAEAPPTLPLPLGAVVGLLGGERRLRRFEAAARSPTVVDAARALGLRPYVVNNAVRSLEGVVGGALLDRTDSRSPHRVTRLGRRLLRQAAMWNEGGEP